MSMLRVRPSSRKQSLVWAVVLWGGMPGLAAQDLDLRERMAAVLRYAGIENASPDAVTHMTQIWTRAQQPGLANAERRAAFRELYVTYYKLHGRDLTGREQALDAVTQSVTTAFEGGSRMDLALPSARGTPSGTYLHVETRGNGPVPLLLISDLGVDGRKLYESFAARQSSAYTMRIVTLPYAGSARPLPWPEKIDIPARRWLTQIEKELLAIIDQPGAAKTTVIGTQGGGYFATRLALLRPEKLRAVVLVNALVHTSMRALADPDAPADPAERSFRSRIVIPGPQLFPTASVPPPDELKRLIENPRSTHPIGRNWMAFAVKDLPTSREWTYEALTAGFFVPSQVYGWEFASTDLTDGLKSLAVPLLAMSSWHDEASPRVVNSSIAQWEEMKLLYPRIPMTHITFADTRAYVSADAPEAFDRALADFLAGRPVRGKDDFTLPRTSPRASVMQAVGNAEIVVEYGRPAAKDRKLWGSLVPYGRVWRAGANDATRFTFSRDIRINGQPLPAGTYTFFAIPRETEWTLIFNRVPRQWGAFDYNPAFDALRFTIKPDATPHQEYLNYRIEPSADGAANVTLNWGQLAVSFRIETGV